MTGVTAPKLVKMLLNIRAIVRVNGVDQAIPPRIDPEVEEITGRLKRWWPGD